MGQHAGGLPADQVQAPRVAGLRHAASEPREANPGETSEAEGSADRDNPAGDRAGVSSGRSVRWAAHWSGGLKSLRRPDEGRRIQRRG
jgi:hypothetical protein